MAPKVEFEGKSLEDAVEKACTELNIEKDRLKYDVLSYGATGIFGIVGAKKAKIRVKGPKADKKTPPPGGQRPPADQKPRAESGKKKKSAKPATAKAAAKEAPKAAAKEAPKAPKAAAKEVSKATVKEGAGGEDANDVADLESWEQERLSLPELEAAASDGKMMLERILAAICDDTRIGVELEGNRIHFDVNGENPAVLIGKKGQTLEAIQYLVEKAVNQGRKTRVRVVVDVEGYWQNRRASLAEMALRMAEKSKETGKPITLGQMNAQDRRIIHLTLKEDPTVKTQSRGDGFYRKLVIFPRKASQGKARQRNG